MLHQLPWIISEGLHQIAVSVGIEPAVCNLRGIAGGSPYIAVPSQSKLRLVVPTQELRRHILPAGFCRPSVRVIGYPEFPFKPWRSCAVTVLARNSPHRISAGQDQTVDKGEHTGIHISGAGHITVYPILSISPLYLKMIPGKTRADIHLHPVTWISRTVSAVQRIPGVRNVVYFLHCRHRSGMPHLQPIPTVGDQPEFRCSDQNVGRIVFDYHILHIDKGRVKSPAGIAVGYGNRSEPHAIPVRAHNRSVAVPAADKRHLGIAVILRISQSRNHKRLVLRGRRRSTVRLLYQSRRLFLYAAGINNISLIRPGKSRKCAADRSQKDCGQKQCRPDRRNPVLPRTPPPQYSFFLTYFSHKQPPSSMPDNLIPHLRMFPDIIQSGFHIAAGIHGSILHDIAHLILF